MPPREYSLQQPVVADFRTNAPAAGARFTLRACRMNLEAEAGIFPACQRLVAVRVRLIDQPEGDAVRVRTLAHGASAIQDRVSVVRLEK